MKNDSVLNKNLIWGAFFVFPFFAGISFFFKILINFLYQSFKGYEPFFLEDYLLRISRICVYPEAWKNEYDFILFLLLLFLGCVGYRLLNKNEKSFAGFMLFGFFPLQILGLILLILPSIKIEFSRYLSFYHPLKEIYAASTFLDFKDYVLISISMVLGILFCYYMICRKKLFSFNEVIIYLVFCSLGFISYYLVIDSIMRLR